MGTGRERDEPASDVIVACGFSLSLLTILLHDLATPPDQDSSGFPARSCGLLLLLMFLSFAAHLPGPATLSHAPLE